MAEAQSPSIGRIVLYHYRWSKDSEVLVTAPAIVTGIAENGDPNLTVFPPGGQPITRWSVRRVDKPEQDCWSWPELKK